MSGTSRTDPPTIHPTQATTNTNSTRTVRASRGRVSNEACTAPSTLLTIPSVIKIGQSQVVEPYVRLCQSPYAVK